MADGFRTDRLQEPSEPTKFLVPEVTVEGAPRAQVEFHELETLWINTGTLCNIECSNCYIESSPSNDRLVYITAEEAAPFIDEAIAGGAREVAFTGGEPFMNPHLFDMAELALDGGLEVLILTNAMRPMMRPHVQARLVRLIETYGTRVKLRISLDHFTAAVHDTERALDAFDTAITGLRWLADQKASISVAGRAQLADTEEQARQGYQRLFETHCLPLDAFMTSHLILFPEMDISDDPPEISEQCWTILGKDPREMMCASSRMLVKRKGASAPAVLACTLIPYDERFNLGPDLKTAARPVKLNHPHCATFCVLGESSCSG